jgi:outer membrane autotransporter protein
MKFNYDISRTSDGDSYFADISSHSWFIASSLGRYYQINDAWSIRPYFRIDFSHSEVNLYSERGEGIQAMKISRQRSNQWRSELALETYWETQNNIKFTGRIGWGHNFSVSQRYGGYFLADQPDPSYFRLSSTPLNRNSFIFGVNAEFPIMDSFSLKVFYDREFSQNDAVHSGTITAIYNKKKPSFLFVRERRYLTWEK